MKKYKIVVKKIEVLEYSVDAEDRFDAYLKLTRATNQSDEVKLVGVSQPQILIENNDIVEITPQ